MKASEVFTPGGIPSITFVDEHLQEKSQHLLDALDMGTTLVSISGPSKSGKTTFVERLIGKENLIQVTGAGISSPADLWLRVFDILGTPISQNQSSSKATGGTLTGKISAQAGVIIAKGGVETSLAGTHNQTATTSENFSIDYLSTLKSELNGTDFVIFIDDFHYIDKQVQRELAEQIKDAMASKCKFICASVPYHSDDVIRSNPDLRGRIFSIDFDYWSNDVLRKIAEQGFSFLNIKPEGNVVDKIVAESAGSPQLMQYLCLNSCYELNVRSKQENTFTFPDSEVLLKKICKRTSLSLEYSTILDKMKEGPKKRGSERNIYISTQRWQGDVYIFLIAALALDPPTLTFRYDNLLARVYSLCLNDKPSGSSVSSACYHSTAIANSTAAGENIIEWDQDSEVLDIRDPYLLFYIRWG